MARVRPSTHSWEDLDTKPQKCRDVVYVNICNFRCTFIFMYLDKLIGSISKIPWFFSAWNVYLYKAKFKSNKIFCLYEKFVYLKCFNDITQMEEECWWFVQSHQAIEWVVETKCHQSVRMCVNKGLEVREARPSNRHLEHFRVKGKRKENISVKPSDSLA